MGVAAFIGAQETTNNNRAGQDFIEITSRGRQGRRFRACLFILSYKRTTDTPLIGLMAAQATLFLQVFLWESLDET